MLLMLPEAHGGENYNRRVTIQSQGKKSRRCWQQVRDGIRTMKTSWPQASVAMCCHSHGSALLARKKKNTTTINHLCNCLGHGNACIRDLRTRDMYALQW